MARIRTIKPEFWTDGALMECSLNARLLFIGTWSFSDDYGSLERSSKQLKARIFPADNIDCEPLVIELITNGLLVEYQVAGKKYLHIRGFSKHQVINRPGKPQCPLYEQSESSNGSLTEHSVNDHGVLTAGREGKGREGSSSTAGAREPITSQHRVIAVNLLDRGKANLSAWERKFLEDLVGKSEISPKMQTTLDAIAGKIGLNLDSVMATWRHRVETARKLAQWDVKWGPMPGQLGCLAPDELLQPSDGNGWTEWRAAS